MNKRCIAGLIVFLCLISQKIDAGPEEGYVEGQILVGYKKGLSEKSKHMIAEQVDVVRAKTFNKLDIDLIELPLDMSVEQGIKKYKFYPKVEIAEPNYYINCASTTPNDTNFSKLWGLNNTGQTVNGTAGTSDADMDAPEAWDVSTGSTSVVIALLDTGVDLDHEDFSGNLWTNPGETAGNNIDDDGNGYIDDVNGWDFVNSDNDPDDDENHGSFMAGIIGATGNNSKGVCGVNWSVKIMPIKILNASGTGTTANAISGVNYAADKNVKVMNASWSGTSSSDTLKSAIEDSNALFVAAAGNNGDGTQAQGWDVDTAGQAIYPASYNSSNVLSVAATDQDDALAGFSNYGATSIDVAAAGKNIYSAEIGNTYDFANGTSAACAYVSGLAGLILAVSSSLTASELKNQITNTVDTKSGLNNKASSGGRINANGAVTASAAPTSLSATAASSSQINLSWSDNSTNEIGFKIERKTDSGSYSQIDTASRNATSYSDTGLSASTAYTYKIRSYNNIGNSSYTSEASATTSGSSGGGGGDGGGGGRGCFIATAAFGTPLSDEVKILSEFRDTCLLKSKLGEEFVGLYYKISPSIARHIEGDIYLKKIVRVIIKFIVFIIRCHAN